MYMIEAIILYFVIGVRIGFVFTAKAVKHNLYWNVQFKLLSYILTFVVYTIFWPALVINNFIEKK